MRQSELRVYLDGEPVGSAVQDRGTHSFTYDPAYLSRRSPTPLSLSLPLVHQVHKNRAVTAYLEGLLPDSEATRQRWAREFGVSPNNAFSLLRHVGRDAAGAVQLFPPDVDPPDAATRTGDVTWLDDDELDDMLHELATHGADWDPGREGGRWSLAGAQPKMALHSDDGLRWGIPRDSTPTTHILKPSLRALPDHHVNEALCLSAARLVEIPAARTTILRRGDVQVLVSQRYDRLRQQDTGRWRRVHQEDLCQALSVHPVQKYQSDGGPGVGEIADLFARRLGLEDRRLSAERFFRALAYNSLIGGTDAHAKNYSLVLNGPRAQLAPLYDVASAAPYPNHKRLASPMRIGRHRAFLDIGDQDWARTASRLGLDAGEGVAVVEELRRRVPEALGRAAAQLPGSVRETADQMAEQIVAHVDGTWRPSLGRDPRRVLPGLDGGA